MKSIVFFALMSLCAGCDLLTETDKYIFNKTGVSMIVRPEVVTIKRIHFEAGSLSGNEIITHGQVKRIGDFNTYAILKDRAGSLLVVLNQIDHKSRSLVELDKEITVWGSINTGKKGLPILEAKSISLK